MQIEKRLKNHYKRWNIELSQEEDFLKYKNRLIKLLNELIGNYIVLNPDIDKYFTEIFNIHKADKPIIKKSQAVYQALVPDTIKALQSNFEYTEKGFGDTNVYKCVNDCNTPKELATVIQFIFWVLENKYEETRDMVSKIVGEIKRLSILTPSVSFQIYKKRKQVIVYPYGEPFLDKGIIDCVISGLEDYPKVAEYFEIALTIYQSGETSQYRNLLDNLRFALEQLLKKILNNNAPLEKQKNTLENMFREKGLHPQVLNLYKELLFNQYSRYQNEAVKHNEAFSVDEIEFMIYLTGNFIRLILQLAKQDKNIAE
ncbi:hypothetical protein [Anabaena sp. UHCC 0399]|uniref:hypothetical protein n=1 Tax=Anabaena sp. UHCC 0399 TaxID=3110238 RepID=UPI002B206F1A|nr:hypothetical protein [Anabaena sp. UHCC 0399]MEA5566239.1 hypothetical protein [Anabaena sp. UHCC 0399]